MGSDYWEPIVWPFRILHVVQDKNGHRVWKQWGGRYANLRQAAGWMTANLLHTDPKRIAMVFERKPGPRIGTHRFRTVTIWEGVAPPPDWFGQGSYSHFPDDLQFDAEPQP